MDQADTLLTIAALSIALAGCSGLVNVLGRGIRSGEADARALRLMFGPWSFSLLLVGYDVSAETS